MGDVRVDVPFRDEISAQESDGLAAIIRAVTARWPTCEPYFFRRQPPGYVLATRSDQFVPSVVIRGGHVVEIALRFAWHAELASLMSAFPHVEAIQVRGWDLPMDMAFVERLPSLTAVFFDGARFVNDNLAAIAKASTIEIIYMRRCGLHAFPEVVTRLPNLRVLDVSDNPIGHEVVVPPEAPDPPWFLERENLRVDGTPIHDYGTTDAERRDTFADYQRAHDAWQTAMATWKAPPPKSQTGLPGIVGDIVGLEELYVARCGLTGLPDDIGKLSRLRVLDVTDNPIGTLPSSLEAMRSLRALHANGCGLTALPYLSGLPLEHVHVAGNRLTEIPDWLVFKASENQLLTHDFGFNPLAKPLEFIDERYDGLPPILHRDDDI